MSISAVIAAIDSAYTGNRSIRLPGITGCAPRLRFRVATDRTYAGPGKSSSSVGTCAVRSATSALTSACCSLRRRPSLVRPGRGRSPTRRPGAPGSTTATPCRWTAACSWAPRPARRSSTPDRSGTGQPRSREPWPESGVRPTARPHATCVKTDAVRETYAAGTTSHGRHDHGHLAQPGNENDDNNVRRFQMREKLLSIGDDYWIEDDQGNRVYRVNGKALRARSTFKLEDPPARRWRASRNASSACATRSRSSGTDARWRPSTRHSWASGTGSRSTSTREPT